MVTSEIGDTIQLLRRGIRHEQRRATTAALRPARRNVAATLLCGTQPSKRYWGDCYRRASDYVLAHTPGHGPCAPLTNVRLVHGVCGDGNVLWAHAWVDLPGSLVFDGVRQQFYDRAGYMRIFRATEEATYGSSAMLLQMVATRHYGPWHEGVLGHNSTRPVPPVPLG